MLTYRLEKPAASKKLHPVGNVKNYNFREKYSYSPTTVISVSKTGQDNSRE
jgi:hypothetical protein